MYIGYHGIIVKNAKMREYDCGVYMASAEFTINGQTAATYTEPKEMSVFPYNLPSVMPEVTYASERAKAFIQKIAARYAEEKPDAAAGRADTLEAPLMMLSELAWTKASYDEARHDYKLLKPDHPDAVVVFYPEVWDYRKPRQKLGWVLLHDMDSLPRPEYYYYRDAQAWFGDSEWTREGPKDVIHSRKTCRPVRAR